MKNSISKRILLNELSEQMHTEYVEDVMFWALEYYAKRGEGTTGEMIAFAIAQRISDEEGLTLSKEI